MPLKTRSQDWSSVRHFGHETTFVSAVKREGLPSSWKWEKVTLREIAGMASSPTANKDSCWGVEAGTGDSLQSPLNSVILELREEPEFLPWNKIHWQPKEGLSCHVNIHIHQVPEIPQQCLLRFYTFKCWWFIFFPQMTIDFDELWNKLELKPTGGWY